MTTLSRTRGRVANPLLANQTCLDPPLHVLANCRLRVLVVYDRVSKDADPTGHRLRLGRIQRLQAQKASFSEIVAMWTPTQRPSVLAL